MKQRIASKGVPAEKLELLEPRMDESLTSIAPEEGVAFRNHYDFGDKFLVTYSGNIGVKHKLDVVIEAAALHRGDDSMLFLIVGHGADFPRIQRRSAELGLKNVRFLPILGEAQFRGLLAASDVCLVTQQKMASEIAFPSKIVTYLAAGCPVVASVSHASEVARITIESGAGRVAEAENAEALLSAIQELRRSALPELSKNARRYARERWSTERVLGNFERNLARVAFPPRDLRQEGTCQR
jgi:colanic acid biosynthesis glycosyl transferase WcaI